MKPDKHYSSAHIQTDFQPPQRPQGVVGPRVFVAENNDINLMYIESILTGLDMSHEVFRNGLEIVEAYTERSKVPALPEVILMDIAMPICDGVEATKKIREFEIGASLPRIPILALTAHAIPGLRESYLAAGMDGHLSKPYSPTQLIDTLVSWNILS